MMSSLDQKVADTLRAIVASEGGENAVAARVRIRQAMAREMSTLLGPGERSDCDHRYRDYLVCVAGGLTELEARLRAMRSLDIAAAPEPLVLFPTEAPLVLLARYWACPGEQLVDAESDSERIPAEAAARFRRDMHALAAHDLLHPYAGRGFYSWRISEQSRTVVLLHWIAQLDCTPTADRSREGGGAGGRRRAAAPSHRRVTAAAHVTRLVAMTTWSWWVCHPMA
jgi:hypothetical protein